MYFSRRTPIFTKRVDKAFTIAKEEAKALNHNYVGTEHLLLGLMQVPEGVAARALSNLSVKLDEVRRTIEAIAGRGSQAISGEFSYNSRAKRAIELAGEEARKLKSRSINTEHLLLGIIQEGQGIAVSALLKCGLTLDQIRIETLRVLQQETPHQAHLSKGADPTPQVPTNKRVLAPENLPTSKAPLSPAASDPTGKPSPELLQPELPSKSEVFIVHGHEEASRYKVAQLLNQVGLSPLILRDLPGGGRTIIENFEDYASRAVFAVVLLTPDDVGGPKEEKEQKFRARQNVIFEHGYFIGKLGRQRVCALYKEGVEIPSDLSGILYILMDDAGAWRYTLAREIKHAGIDIDVAKLFS